MKKSKYSLIVVALLASLVACNTIEKDLLPEESFLTVRIEQDDTKVSVNDDNGKLSWNTGDKIAIHVGSAFVEKEITTSGADNPVGQISVPNPAQDYTRNFFAVYPSNIKDDSFYGDPTLKVTLPTSYDITDKDASYSPMPMVAINTAGLSFLEFRHVCGLLRITLTGVVSSTKTVRVTFDRDVTGSFSVTDARTTIPKINTKHLTDRNVVLFTVAHAGESAPSTAIVLNIPVPCGTYDKVTVAALNGNGTAMATQSFEGLNYTFARHQGRKMTFGQLNVNFAISNPVENIARTGESVIYNYSETVDVSVNDLRGNSLSPAPWRAYFSSTDASPGDAVSGSWSTTPLPDSNGNNWLTLSAYTGDGNSNAVRVNLKASPFTPAPTRTPSTEAASEISALQSGSGVSTIDLSRVDILASPGTMEDVNKAETANCYVIKKYGTYLIPCVYGNALQNDTYVTSAYTTSNTGNVLNTFVNADGNPIGNAVIPRDGNLTKSANLVARVVWQDTQPGCEILTDDDVTYISSDGTAGVCPYIRVIFRQASIAPGNIVVALYDQDYGKILWSWHLWVTSQSLSVIPTKRSDSKLDPLDTPSPDPDPYAAGRMTNKFLNVNLGWVPPISYGSANTTARSQYVILVSTSDNKVVDSFRVSQDVYSLPATTATAYSNPFFQWGRKDPFLPSSGTANSNKSISRGGDFPAYDRTSNTIPTMSDGSTAVERLRNMTLYPYKYFADGNNYPGYLNLWNTALNVASGVHMAVTKSVYDPAPRGYHLQRRYDFTGFVNDGGYWPMSTEGRIFGEWQDVSGRRPAGMTFTKDHSLDSETWVHFFPAVGFRDEDGVVDDVCVTGNYWTSVPQYEAQAFYLDYGTWGVNCQANSRFKVMGCPVRPVQY